MADYIKLNSSNDNGSFSISTKVFRDITEYSVPRIEHVALHKKPVDSIEVVSKNGVLVINLDVDIKKGCNIPKTIKALQERIHLNVTQNTEVEPKEINVRVTGYIEN